MPKYYGPDEVKDSIVGSEGVTLTLAGGKTIFISKKMFDVVITDKPVDLTDLRTARLFPVVKEILQLMLDWDVKINEIEYVFTLVTTSFNVNFKQASDIAWGTAEDERTMRDVESMIESSKK